MLILPAQFEDKNKGCGIVIQSTAFTEHLTGNPARPRKRQGRFRSAAYPRELGGPPRLASTWKAIAAWHLICPFPTYHPTATYNAMWQPCSFAAMFLLSCEKIRPHSQIWKPVDRYSKPEDTCIKQSTHRSSAPLTEHTCISTRRSSFKHVPALCSVNRNINGGP